jgi:hypothetical protein
LKSFEVFENELVKYGGKITDKIPKKYFNTIPKTYTLPIEVVDRLNYYSNVLGVKKSHLVMSSIEIELNRKIDLLPYQ